MLTFIGILLCIFTEMLFSEYAPPQSTNWSVFYFVGNFGALLIISLDQFIKTNDKFTRWMSVLFVGFFAVLVVQFLLQLGKPYEAYRTCVNDPFIDLIRYIFFIISVVLICINFIMKWAKR